MSAQTHAPSPQTALECPECTAPLDLVPRMLGELVDCGGCGAELECVSLSPLLIELAPEVEEDWGE
jgi:alpha-aminoadipate/glutamate carrier protein LysW